MRLFRPCFFTVLLFPEAFFRKKTDEKILFLTFDDGPDVISTISLLNILAKHKVKAVFFCSGKTAFENPDLINKIKAEGHLIGNHCYNHPDGLFTSKQKYLGDVRKAERFTSHSLFRPPYGRLRINQYREIKKTYNIVMWDVMPYDFDRQFGGRRSLDILKKLIRPGSVIVLHDSRQSTIPEFLDEFILFAAGEGYRFAIPESAG
ncbi:MAG: polysaccharide deacetylase family protein [Odoribacter sp.]|nr:polysaccharide deacetylase family protein [Odoribacter sp.]